LNFFKRIANIVDHNSKRLDDSDAIFSLTSSSILLEEKLNLFFTGKASISIKSTNGTFFNETIMDCKDFLKVSKEEFKLDFKIIVDRFNYIWIIIIGRNSFSRYENITNVAGAISSIDDIIVEKGFENQLLASLFQFSESLKLQEDTKEEKDMNQQSMYVTPSITLPDLPIPPVYLLYNYKENNFYPYLPLDNDHRDTSKELQIASILKSTIPFENDYLRWFPIKDIPF
jgi:hypothetical protein